VVLALAISVALCAAANHARFSALFDHDGIANVSAVLSGLAHPDLSSDFVTRVAGLAFQSLLIGGFGTVLATVLGFGLAYFAAHIPALPDPPGVRFLPTAVRAAIRQSARLTLGFFRTIPDLVWAYLFVRILGLGPGPGVLAIAVSTGGSIGKLFAELAESVDPRPVRSLAAAGAGRFGQFFYGVLPQVRKQWVAYVLYRVECSVRSASILGVVGAGGLGTEIALDVRYFEYDKLATTLFAVLAFVIALEVLSGVLRRRSMWWTTGIAAATSLAALVFLDIPWRDLVTPSSLAQSWSFAIGFGHPSPGLSGRAFWLALQTLTMAWCATGIAFLFAVFLSPLASATLTVRNYLEDGYRTRGVGRVLSWALLLGARMVLQIGRALPELTLALVFVVWVGPGPLAGILAIAVHTVGVLGRLYLDSFELVEPEPVAALESIGSGRVASWLYGVLPQAAPRLMAYTLYRFEVAVRATAIVGFVGAGGIGDLLYTSISLFHMGDLVVVLGVLLAVVFAADVVGDRVRVRILRGPLVEPDVVMPLILDDLDSSAADPSVRRRKRRRMEVSQIVRYRLANRSVEPFNESFVTSRLLNLSPMGMFICSETPFGVGTNVEVELFIPDGSHPRVTCKVVSVRAAGEGEAAGMGVKFLDIDAVTRASIVDMVARGNTMYARR
jgi:phosphonate transport system permease protein